MTTHDAPDSYDESGLSFTTTETMGQARIREFERPGCAGQRGVVLEDERRGTTVGVRLDLTPNAPLRDVSPTSMDALAFLGALTRVLQSRNLQAQLIGGEHGLEAVLVSRHICGSDQRPDLRTHVAEISEVIEGIESSLHGRGQELIDSILNRTAPLHVGVLKDLRPAIGRIIVPTFDEAQRDRMMNRS
jgi:hypothetical protein